jgi:hypothetical protein
MNAEKKCGRKPQCEFCRKQIRNIFLQKTLLKLDRRRKNQQQASATEQANAAASDNVKWEQ